MGAEFWRVSSDFRASFFFAFSNLFLGLFPSLPSSLKEAFWPFARPRPSPQTTSLGFGKGRARGGGGATKIQIFSRKPSPTTLQIVFFAFWGAWARVAKSKTPICNLFFWPVSSAQLPKLGFSALCQAPSKPPNSQFGSWEGGGGGPPKFRFSAKNQAPPPQLAFWPFGGLGQGWQNPKIKFVIWFFGLEIQATQLPKMGFLVFLSDPVQAPR